MDRTSISGAQGTGSSPDCEKARTEWVQMKKGKEMRFEVHEFLVPKCGLHKKDNKIHSYLSV